MTGFITCMPLYFSNANMDLHNLKLKFLLKFIFYSLCLCTIAQICHLSNCKSGAFFWNRDLDCAVRLAVTHYTVIVSPTSISNCHMENCVLHINLA